MRLSDLAGTGEFTRHLSRLGDALDSDGGSGVAEQNQWNAMLEMCFHDVIAQRLVFAAGPHSGATLAARKTC